MEEHLDHLDLSMVPEEFSRKKKSGYGYEETSRDKDKFYKVEIKELASIKEDFRKTRKKYEKYVQPQLIFKLNLNQSVSDEIFRKELGYADINIVKSSSDKKDYWVAFTTDEDFKKFKKKLDLYSNQNKKNFFTAIDSIKNIPPKDKIGDLLRKKPFQDNEVNFLDVEIWRMDEDRLSQFLKGFRKMVKDNDGKLTDEMVTKNFCLVRIYTNKTLFDNVLGLPEVALVDRPPEVEISQAINVDLEKFEPTKPPHKDSHGVLILDSGLRHHPLLENAIAEETHIPLSNGMINSPYDDVGHGTEVAGIALYGDIMGCIERGQFVPDVWIYSSKVLYRGSDDGKASGDPEKLLEHQLRDAVEKILHKHRKCRVINISFANLENKMFEGQRQFNLAALLDELCIEYEIIIVVSVGNNKNYSIDEYPDYLLDGSKDIKIADPSSSALSLSVGSVFRRRLPAENRFIDIPSPFTRVGPGYRGMIKPELVEYGGGHSGEGIVTLNPDWITEGSLFRRTLGTSLSAPRVSNHLAKILNKFNNFSANLVKALLLSSTEIPNERPGNLNSITLHSNETSRMRLHNVYGYGKPDLEKALFFF